MNGILLINKEKGITSRDVVNQISKKLNIKKVGHAGTLDPLATGLLVIGVGNGTKIMDLLTVNTKEYIATVKLGIQTDTMDITGNIIKEQKYFPLNKEDILKVLESFIGTYNQTVPKYSAVKINGKKLYEYARNNIEVELPKRLVEIFKIELLNYDYKKQEFTFKTLVSKGTYIRSLIDDIGKKLNIPITMKDLIRTKSGKFSLTNAINVSDNIDKLISIKDALDYKVLEIKDEILLKRIKNGNQVTIPNLDELYVVFTDSTGLELAIYKNNGSNNYMAFKVL